MATPPLLPGIICPSCGGSNKPHPAKPLIVKENGSYSCTYCGSAWTPPKEAA